jgi:thioredoxin 1
MLKKMTVALLLILPLLVLAEVPPIPFTPYKTAAAYIGKGKPVMLEVGAESCVNCKTMNQILAPIVAKHPSYRIFDIILTAPAVNILSGRPAVSTEEKLNIHAIPAQIFYDASGKEVYRHTGILDAGQLMSIFKKLKF